MAESFLQNVNLNVKTKPEPIKRFDSVLKIDSDSCFHVFDSECSIKCILEDSFLKKLLAQNKLELRSLEGKYITEPLT